VIWCNSHEFWPPSSSLPRSNTITNCSCPVIPSSPCFPRLFGHSVIGCIYHEMRPLLRPSVLGCNSHELRPLLMTSRATCLCLPGGYTLTAEAGGTKSWASTGFTRGHHVSEICMQINACIAQRFLSPSSGPHNLCLVFPSPWGGSTSSVSVACISRVD